MADKSVGELIAAQTVTPTDLFVLEQNGTAKKLTGQTLENWLVSFADGHGGIQSIVKIKTNVLADTYRITLADTTTFDFVVTNGRGVNSITKKSTSGLVDTYTIKYNDGTTGTFTVTNGAKGDKGDNQYVWIKYASQKPTASSHSFGDVADNWIGIYSGASETAPTDWTQYEWFQIKGDKGDTGEAARLMSSAVEYQVSDSGTIIPSGVWSSAVPVVAQGKYLWTRTTNNFNTGSSVVSYSVSRMGLDGSGSVSSVANISPDGNGNVPLTAENINALPNTGGDLTGELRMNGQTISGLNAPMANDQAANMGFVNQRVRKAAPRNLLDNSDFTNPVNQRGLTSYTGNGYTIDRWMLTNNYSQLGIVSGGVKISCVPGGKNAYPRQYLDGSKLGGKTFTGVACLEDGSINLCTGVFPADTVTQDTSFAVVTGGGLTLTLAKSSGGNFVFQMQVAVNKSITVKWAALYEGEYTLETLPEYQPKGYGAELAECKRYALSLFDPIVDYQTVCPVVATSETQGIGIVPLPTPLRINQPSLSVSDITKLILQSDAIYGVTDLRLSNTSNVAAKLVVTVAGGLTIGRVYSLADSGEVNVIISAEL